MVDAPLPTRVLPESPSAGAVPGATSVNRLAAALALAAFLAAMVAIAVSSATSGESGSAASSATTSAATTKAAATARTTTRAAPPKPVRVKLTAVGAFDPEGDGQENDSLADLAVDGDPSTYWKTEHYRSFTKNGVGLLLDAGRRRKLSKVIVRSDSPSFTAQVQLGNDPKGPFRAVSGTKRVNRGRTFLLRKGAAGRYVLVWIRSLPSTDEAHVNEVRAVYVPAGSR